MDKKWSLSTDQEHYHGTFGSRDEAIAEGRSYYKRFWVGQCVTPTQPEEIWDASNWLETVWCHEDYQGDWAEGQVSPSKEQLHELSAQVTPVIAAWLDRHNLRPKHFVINYQSVEEITTEGELDDED